jgi:hypothetical protein
MPRSIDGHGFDDEQPPSFGGQRRAVFVDDAGRRRRTATGALPGLVGVTPGSGEIMIAPVSVCHHVSTIGQRSPPITRWYHIHASGLMGSPTRAEQAQRRQVVPSSGTRRPAS